MADKLIMLRSSSNFEKSSKHEIEFKILVLNNSKGAGVSGRKVCNEAQSCNSQQSQIRGDLSLLYELKTKHHDTILQR